MVRVPNRHGTDSVLRGEFDGAAHRVVPDHETHAGIAVHDFECSPSGDGPDPGVRGHGVAKQPLGIDRQAQDPVTVNPPQIGQHEIGGATGGVLRRHAELAEEREQKAFEVLRPRQRLTGHGQASPLCANMASGAALTITDANTQGTVPRLCQVCAVPRWMSTSPGRSRVSSLSVTATTSPDRMML